MQILQSGTRWLKDSLLDYKLFNGRAHGGRNENTCKSCKTSIHGQTWFVLI